jgi:integrase
MKIMDDSQHLFPRRESQPLLGEPSLASAIAAIKADTSIPDLKRRHWVTSMTVIAKAIGRPPESLPCRMTSLRHHIGRLNAPAQGWEQKTFSNHKSNVKAAINHVMKVQNLPTRGAPLSPDWIILFEAILDVKPRRLLSGFARYCSVRSIDPSDVTEDLVFQYFGFRETTGFLHTGVALPRELMKAWNSCVENVQGWPQRLLNLPGLPKATSGPAWEKFPESLRKDIEAYLADIAKLHRSANGRRRRSNKASTITTRRRELIAFARTAVMAGAPIQNLTSLAALLHPQVVTPALEVYLERNGEQPKGYTIDLSWKLLSIAKTIAAPLETITHLDDSWARLEQDRGPVLTQKNLAVIRAVMMSDIWAKVCTLPRRLMDKAQRMLNWAPKKALSLATIALQIQILTRAPVRIGNLLSIRLDHNLQRIDGAKSSYRLYFPDCDVKNRNELDYPLSGSTAEMIDEFIHAFRPHIGTKQMGDWLFPGENGKSRSAAHASAFIAATVEQEVGLRLTAHQFRHAAAAVILKERVGDYEFVRRILGHLNIVTTTRFYTALESFPASKAFGDIIESQMAKHLSLQKLPRTRRKTLSGVPSLALPLK